MQVMAKRRHKLSQVFNLPDNFQLRVYIASSKHEGGWENPPNLSKRGKNFPQYFFIISLSAKVMPSCVFHPARVVLVHVLFSLALRRGEGGGRGKLFSISFIFVLEITLRVLKISNRAGKHRKRDVTTVFTYSRLNDDQ